MALAEAGFTKFREEEARLAAEAAAREGKVVESNKFNAAFRKPAVQSSNGSEDYYSKRLAADAVRDTLFDAFGSGALEYVHNRSPHLCAHTKREARPFWRVDLGTIIAVDHVGINWPAPAAAVGHKQTDQVAVYLTAGDGDGERVAQALCRASVAFKRVLPTGWTLSYCRARGRYVTVTPDLGGSELLDLQICDVFVRTCGALGTGAACKYPYEDNVAHARQFVAGAAAITSSVQFGSGSNCRTDVNGDRMCLMTATRNFGNEKVEVSSDARWAVDGDVRTCVATTEGEAGARWSLDLGADTYVQSVTLVGLPFSDRKVMRPIVHVGSSRDGEDGPITLW